MSDNCVFERYEMKYLLNKSQYAAVSAYVSERLAADSHGESTIFSLYFDTPDYLLIRRSIEKPVYKEKLRLRSYGAVGDDGTVYLELKKKYKDVVYKRRVELRYADAKKTLSDARMPLNCQIAKEINYALEYYKTVTPAMLLSYDRTAYYAEDGLRITFDKNVLYRSYDLSLSAGAYGEKLLPDGFVLMEIKTGAALPLWLVKMLDEGGIYKTSFSKYGTAYRKTFERREDYKNVG